ncbi:MAG: GTP-binding protein [Flavobacteriaceae bacterium]|nr:GTP-binding protein [Flavobacteriaceae bacterium]
MELGEEIVLRPRFKMELEQSSDWALQTFEKAKEETTQFVIHRSDDHVFIKIPKDKQHYWSPQLDLEIYQFEGEKTHVRGLFGPKPSVWTMFMFFHFVVIGLVLGVSVWAYSNAALQQPYFLQLVALFFLAIGWFALYFAGRMGKSAGKKEMIALNKFMYETLQL